MRMNSFFFDEEAELEEEMRAEDQEDTRTRLSKWRMQQKKMPKQPRNVNHVRGSGMLTVQQKERMKLIFDCYDADNR